MKVKVTLLCPTLCELMDYTVHGILQARTLEWVAFLQGIFPTQGSNPGLPHCRRILYQLSHKRCEMLTTIKVTPYDFIYDFSKITEIKKTGEGCQGLRMGNSGLKGAQEPGG